MMRAENCDERFGPRAMTRAHFQVPAPTTCACLERSYLCRNNVVASLGRGCIFRA
jgi:hypothetical protein